MLEKKSYRLNRPIIINNKDGNAHRQRFVSSGTYFTDDFFMYPIAMSEEGMEGIDGRDDPPPSSTPPIGLPLSRPSRSAEPVLYSSKQAVFWDTMNHHWKALQRKSGSLLVGPAKEKTMLLKLLKAIPLPFVVYFLVVFTFGVIAIIYHHAILDYLNAVSIWVLGLEFWGYVFCCSLCFITSFPFTLGHSLSILLCGLSFGFPMGFVPAFIGSLTGAAFAFLLSRKFLQRRVKKYIEHSPSITFARDMISKHQIKFLFIFRMAPLPFNIINFICSGFEIRLVNYLLVTSIISLKMLLPVYVGAALKTIAQTYESGISRSDLIELIAGIAFIFIFMGLSTFTYFKYKKQWEEKQHQFIEVETCYSHPPLLPINNYMT